MLQDFFRDLDASVGRGNYLAVLTADHGFMPAPEMAAAKGEPSGRISSSQLLGRVNAGLEKKFGEGKWLLGNSAASLLLDKRLVAQKKVALDTVADEARALLLAEPGIGTAYTRRELESADATRAVFRGVEQVMDPDVWARCSSRSRRTSVGSARRSRPTARRRVHSPCDLSGARLGARRPRRHAVEVSIWRTRWRPRGVPHPLPPRANPCRFRFPEMMILSYAGLMTDWEFLYRASCWLRRLHGPKPFSIDRTCPVERRGTVAIAVMPSA